MITRRIARRYLFSPKSHSVVNWIAALSVAALAMPTAAMIILLAVMGGFSDLASRMSSAFDAPVTLTKEQPFPIGQPLDGASYLLETQAIVRYGDRQAIVTLRGVDDAYREVYPEAGTVVSGSFSPRLGDYDRLIIGRELASQLGIRTAVSTDVQLLAIRRNAFSSLLPMDGYSSVTLPLAGIFAHDLEHEQKYAITSLRAVQNLTERPGQASAIGLLKPRSLEGFQAHTRAQMNATFYRLVRFERAAIFIISLLVLILASFSVVGTLVMLSIEKRADRATLKALGADTPLIRKIFIAEGCLIGGLGGAIGVVLGVGLCLVQQHFGLIRIPVQSMLVDTYPVTLRVQDVLAVIAALSVVVFAASWLTVRKTIR